jgi:hypothetical protein
VLRIMVARRRSEVAITSVRAQETIDVELTAPTASR